MTNAWSLAASILNGTFDKDYPIMTDTKITPQESDEYDPKPKSDTEDTDWNDPIIGAPSSDTFTMLSLIHI